MAIANEIFSPTPAQIAWARRIADRMAAAASDGQGAIGIEGVLIDRAHVKLAEKILARATLFQGAVA